MEGIQILYSEPVYIATSFSRGFIIGMFLLAFALFVLGLFVYEYEKVLNACSIICLIIGAVFVVLMANNASPLFSQETDKKEYKCTISEDVSMIEFYEKYSVIDREGDLWTIREK